MTLIVGVGCGILWTVMTVSMGAPRFFPLFGIVIVGGAITFGLKMSDAADKYRVAKRRYDSERSQIERELNAQK